MLYTPQRVAEFSCQLRCFGERVDLESYQCVFNRRDQAEPSLKSVVMMGVVLVLGPEPFGKGLVEARM